MPDHQTTRICRYCQRETPIEKFARDNKRRPTWECRECENARKQKWAKAKRESLPVATDADLKQQCQDHAVSIMTRLNARRTITTRGCWEWDGAKRGNRQMEYGKIEIAVPGKQALQVSVHRLSAVLFGIIDPCSELLVLHKCDNPPCFNPDHLFAGTYADNAQDALQKGRMNPPKGDAHHWSKLRELDVKEIKRRLSSGETARAIAESFTSVSIWAIYEIKQGKVWSHV